ncbi:ABC transporter ATP-binding protein [Candidatus Gottesmanbacteria bacterium]|nr:ABC transporter ATP-binding protein [Candidatus Gottesmanbacteria bacterium]
MNLELKINGKDIKNLKPDERAREGLFLAFQNPVAIPGVSVANLLKTAYQIIQSTNYPINKLSNQQIKKTYNPALSVWEFNEMLVEKAKKLGIPQEFLRRSLNEAFSGGEKKKLEMLQALVLEPKYAIFDEIDTGLDVDALKIVAKAIDELKKTGCGVVVITHYQRILKFAKPDFVHILVKGKIVASDGGKLAQTVEKSGYKKWSEN